MMINKQIINLKAIIPKQHQPYKQMSNAAQKKEHNRASTLSQKIRKSKKNIQNGQTSQLINVNNFETFYLQQDQKIQAAKQTLKLQSKSLDLQQDYYLLNHSNISSHLRQNNHLNISNSINHEIHQNQYQLFNHAQGNTTLISNTNKKISNIFHIRDQHLTKQSILRNQSKYLKYTEGQVNDPNNNKSIRKKSIIFSNQAPKYSNQLIKTMKNRSMKSKTKFNLYQAYSDSKNLMFNTKFKLISRSLPQCRSLCKSSLGTILPTLLQYQHKKDKIHMNSTYIQKQRNSKSSSQYKSYNYGFSCDAINANKKKISFTTLKPHKTQKKIINGSQTQFVKQLMQNYMKQTINSTKHLIQNKINKKQIQKRHYLQKTTKKLCMNHLHKSKYPKKITQNNEKIGKLLKKLLNSQK